MAAPLLALALFLAASSAALGQAAVGPVSVEADIEEMEPCTLQPAGVCLVAWDPGSDEGIGDDHIDTRTRVERVAVGVHAPGAVPPVSVGVRPRDVVVQHGAGGVVRPALLRVSETIPPDVEPFAYAELRNHWFLVFVNLPEPLRNPVNGRSDVHLPVPLDCAALFTDYARWDEACTSDELRPLPNGANFTDDTDRMLAVTVAFAACEYALAYVVPDACPIADAVHGAGQPLLALWHESLPKFSQGGAVESVAARIEPSTTGASWSLERPRSSEVAGSVGWPRGAPPADGVRAAASSPGRAPWHAGSLEATAAPWMALAAASPASAVPLEQRDVVLVTAALAAAAAMLSLVLYHRVTRARALDQAMRHRIYHLLTEEPGLRTGTIAGRCGIAHNTAKHHLKLLVELGLASKVGRGHARYFAKGRLSPEAQRQAEVLNVPSVRRVHDFLLAHGPADLPAMVQRLRLAKSTVSAASVALAAAGLAERTRRGHVVQVRALPAAVPRGPLRGGEAPSGVLATLPEPS